MSWDAFNQEFHFVENVSGNAALLAVNSLHVPFDRDRYCKVAGNFPSGPSCNITSGRTNWPQKADPMAGRAALAGSDGRDWLCPMVGDWLGPMVGDWLCPMVGTGCIRWSGTGCIRWSGTGCVRWSGLAGSDGRGLAGSDGRGLAVSDGRDWLYPMVGDWLCPMVGDWLGPSLGLIWWGGLSFLPIGGE